MRVSTFDDALAGSGCCGHPLAIATVLGTGGRPDHLRFESTDARMSVVPAMVAERLGLPQLTFANKVEAPGDGTVKIHRLTDYGYDVVEASTPAVISVVEKINEPRYPSFKGIMAAKKKPVETVTVADAGSSRQPSAFRRGLERGRRVRCCTTTCGRDHRHRRG